MSAVSYVTLMCTRVHSYLATRERQYPWNVPCKLYTLCGAGGRHIGVHGSAAKQMQGRNGVVLH